MVVVRVKQIDSMISGELRVRKQTMSKGICHSIETDNNFPRTAIYIHRVAKCFNVYFGFQQHLRASTFDNLQFVYRVFLI